MKRSNMHFHFIVIVFTFQCISLASVVNTFSIDDLEDPTPSELTVEEIKPVPEKKLHPPVAPKKRRKQIVQREDDFDDDDELLMPDINDVIFTPAFDYDKPKDDPAPHIDDRNHMYAEYNVTPVIRKNTTEESATPPKNITVECKLRELPEDEIPSVSVTNSSVLLKVLVPSNTTNVTAADCTGVLFFSSQCIFSARMAPHYNALARVFPGITFYALDTSLHNNIHVRYGIVSVPNVLLFHNAKPVARYNDTYFNLENLVGFISRYTTLPYNGTLNVTSADMNGPVPASFVKKVDYVLIIAWTFLLFCICFHFLKSSLCHKIVECVRNTWIEAQHEHTD